MVFKMLTIALASALPMFYTDDQTSSYYNTKILLYENRAAYHENVERPALFESSRKKLEDQIRAVQALVEEKKLAEAIKAIGPKAALDLILIRGELYLLAGEPQKARLDFEKIITAQPSGRLRALALDGLRRCLKMKIKDGRLDIYAPLILTLKQEWRNEEALALLSEAYEKTLPTKILELLKEEEPILALRLGHYEKAQKLWGSPKNLSQKQWLATAKLRDGRFAEAADLRLSLAKSFSKGKLRQKEFERALNILAKGGLYQEALTLAQKTPELKDKIENFNWVLGLSALGANLPTEAQKHFSAILKNKKFNKDHVGAEYYLARSLELAGQKKEARKIFQRIADDEKTDYYSILARGRLGNENLYLKSKMSALLENGHLHSDRQTLGYFLWLSDKGLMGTNLPEAAQALLNTKAEKIGQTEKILQEIADGSLTQAAGELNYFADDYCQKQKDLGAKKDDINRLMASLAAWSGNYRLAVRIFSLIKSEPGKKSQKWSHPLIYSAAVLTASRNLGLAPQLILSVIRTESAYQADVISVSNAQGLMQLLPATANKIAEILGEKKVRPLDLFDPALNIRYGTWYLNELEKGFGATALALAGYNGGPYNIKRLIETKGPWPLDVFIDTLTMDETIKYVKRITESQYIYEKEYLSEAAPRDFSEKIKPPQTSLPAF